MWAFFVTKETLILNHEPHETQLSGSSKEQLISAILSSSVFATGSAMADLSKVNLIASVADFVLK